MDANAKKKKSPKELGYKGADYGESLNGLVEDLTKEDGDDTRFES